MINYNFVAVQYIIPGMFLGVKRVRMEYCGTLPFPPTVEHNLKFGRVEILPAEIWWDDHNSRFVIHTHDDFTVELATRGHNLNRGLTDGEASQIRGSLLDTFESLVRDYTHFGWVRVN